MTAPAATPNRVLHLSLVLGGDLLGRAGGRIGRVDDLVVRLGDDGYPPVTGLLARIAGRQVFVSAEAVAELDQGAARLATDRLDLRPFGRRPQEVLLGKDVLDRQLIDVDGARLRRANDLDLARLDGWWRVVGVDVGPRGIVRRILPRRYGRWVGDSQVLDWSLVEPFTGHVPTVRLRIPHPKLVRLHPAELADLVEAASHNEGREIIHAVGDDEELEADVFEELDPQHRREFVEERPDQEVAHLLERMEPDDAVDLLGDLPDERREEVIRLLPPVQRRRVRALAGYDPATAGGLMSPEFVCLYAQASKGEAIERIERSRAPADTLGWIYVMNLDRRLKGAIALADLLRAPPGDAMGDVATFLPPRVPPEADIEEVARLMTDYDLTVVPVVDGRDQILGVVSVDDVLEMVLPRGWRRRFDVLGGG